MDAAPLPAAPEPAVAYPAAGCSFDELLGGVQQVLDIFVARGFAINATLSDATPSASGRGGSFRVKLEGPANLYALQVRCQPACRAKGEMPWLGHCVQLPACLPRVHSIARALE